MVPYISAQKLSLTGPSTGSDDESKILCRGCLVEMIHAAVMLCGVALPSLTMSIEGRENMSISFDIRMGKDKIDPMIRLCSEENMVGR